MKHFEAGMRALLGTFIQADPVEQVATFDKGLVQLIVERLSAQAAQRSG